MVILSLSFVWYFLKALSTGQNPAVKQVSWIYIQMLSEICQINPNIDKNSYNIVEKVLRHLYHWLELFVCGVLLGGEKLWKRLQQC